MAETAPPRMASADESEVRFFAEPARLRMQVLEGPGAPLCSQQVAWWLGGVSSSGSAASSDGVVSTDAQGSVVLRLPKRALALSERWLVLRLGATSGAQLSLPKELAGETDLGVLTLAPIPMLAAGMVVDGAGKPLAAATVELTIDGVGGEDPRVQRWDVTESDGRFELRGWAEGGSQVRLQAALVGALPSPVMQAPLGSVGLMLSVSPRGSLVGLILHGCSDSPANLRLLADPRDPEQEELSAKPDREGQVFLPEIPSGVYDLSVVLDGGHAPLLELRDVAVDEGERVAPPALNPFDARGSLQEVLVRTEDPEHRQHPATLFFRAAGADESAWARMDSPGLARLVATASGLDLRATGFGYRTVERHGCAGAVTLIRGHGYTLVLRLREPAGLPEPWCWLSVDLKPAPEVAPQDKDALMGNFGPVSCTLHLSEPGHYMAALKLSCLTRGQAELGTSARSLEDLKALFDSVRPLELELPVEVRDVAETQEVWVDLGADAVERALGGR